MIQVAIGAILGFLAVALGAFGAHGLKSMLSESLLATFETGVKYHIYHSLALLLTGVLSVQFKDAGFETAGWFFLAGTFIFSGSLYILALTGIKWLGAITPIGGVAFLIGWGWLAVSAFKLIKT